MFVLLHSMEPLQKDLGNSTVNNVGIIFANKLTAMVQNLTKKL
jgi:hypothetical protein